MPVEVRIESLRFANGASILAPKSGTLVVVGPNSSGKSSLLREIYARCFNPPPIKPHMVLDDIVAKKSGTVEDVIRWFQENVSPETFISSQHELGFKGSSGEISVSGLRAAWGDSDRIGYVAQFFVASHWAEERLRLLQEASLHDLIYEQPTDPMQYLYSNTRVEAKLARWVRAAFGIDITLNRYGASIGLRIGKLSRDLPPPPPPRDILREYAEMRSISTEGDGVKAFIGLLLQVMHTSKKVTIIDEPEAFLHPPQARRLGRLLGESAPVDGQLIVATHSRHFLQGVLEYTGRPVQIVRLKKEAETFVPATVLPVRIKQTWADPLLRYSDLLDGLFHDGVILCEGDGDCRFYQAVMDACVKDDPGGLDLMFTHVGGKSRLGKAARQLHDFHVRSAIIADLDLLNDASVLRSTIEGAGGRWENFNEDFQLVSAAVQAMGPSILTVDAARAQISTLLSKLPGKAPVSTGVAEAIKAAVAFRSPWQQIKLGGLSVLPYARSAADRLLRELETIGIFLVPVGELERWIPLDVKKQSWVVEVLEKSHYATPPAQLVDFLRRIVSYFADDKLR
ncbi:ATP-dependent nuclease [Micromonospora sp. NPDC049836]|uniref:ATP-dependent nuclease n=1 Tax=Micromonospora sp. NPDC049836 TaxID=3364274 RepID=UPI0037A8316B